LSRIVPAQTTIGLVRGFAKGSEMLTFSFALGMPFGSNVTYGWPVKLAAIWGPSGINPFEGAVVPL